MKQIRELTIALFLGVALFFNIERLDFKSDNLVNMSPFVYVLGFAFILAIVAFPWFRRLQKALAVFTYVTLYLVIRFLILGKTELGDAGLYIIVAEITIPSFLILLSYRFSRALTDFEEAVEEITLDGFTRKLQSLPEAEALLQRELRLSRRKQRPLSVVLVECEPESGEKTLNRAMQEVQSSIVRRHSLLSLSRAMDRLLRASDLMLEEPGTRRLVLVCPETTHQSSMALAERVQEVADKLGLNVSCSSACLPDDALTFEELLKKAEANLNRTHGGPSLAVFATADSAHQRSS